MLSVLPLSFTYGLYQLLATFRSGGTLVLEHSFAFPVEILARIQQERVTGFPGVPTIFSTLLRLDLSSCDLSSLRYLTNAAAALIPTHIADLRRLLPGVAFYFMYGQTETARTLYLPPALAEQKPEAVGYLSGGLDSAMIAAVIRNHTFNRLDTFSIAFNDASFDESQSQRHMADFLGTQHQVVEATHAEIGRVFPDVIWHAEVPLMRTAPAPMFMLSARVRACGCKVVLTGEGADEFLAGYDIFKEDRIR